MNPCKVLVVAFCVAVMPFMMAAEKRVTSPPPGDGAPSHEVMQQDKLTPGELASWGEAFNAPYYVVTNQPLQVTEGCSKLFAVRSVSTLSGMHFVTGERIPVGEVIVSGIALNESWEDAGLLYAQYPDPDDAVTLISGSMVAVNALADGLNQPASAGPEHCSVTCGNSAFFACCNWGPNGFPTCKCVQGSNSNTNCAAGGPGASGCELTQSPPPAQTPGNKQPATSPVG